MEKKIVEGTFKSNIVGMVCLMLPALLFSIFVFWLIAADAILDVDPQPVAYIIILDLCCIYGIYECYSKKNQQLTVTNMRVHGRIRNKGIDLPLDMITHVDITGNTLSITTASGVIKCACCTNIDAVYSVILKLLNERNSSKSSSDDRASVPEELMEYKKLLDNGVITQEEYEAKKKKLLEL